MKLIVAIVVFISFWSVTVAQNNAAEKKSTTTSVNSANGYEIKVTLQPYKNCRMYLGSYYGKNKILADSAWFNEKSEATFKGENKLPGGTGITFYKSDGLHDLKAIINELRPDNHFMLTIQTPRLKKVAEELMDYLHQKYHLE